jgi:hypothetical protein
MGKVDKREVQIAAPTIIEPDWAAPNPDAIPEDLKRQPWGVWKASPRSDKNGEIKLDTNGRPKWNKQPLNPKSGYAATTTKPETFGTFEDAINAYSTGKYSGIGVLLNGKGIIGFDLDNTTALFKQKPEVKKWFDEAYADGIYFERSPSKTGIRGFGLGKLPAGGHNHAGLEIYDDVRFLTVTGDTKRNIPTLKDVQGHADSYLKFFPTSMPKVKGIQIKTGGSGAKTVDDIPLDIKLRLPRIFDPDSKSNDKYKRLFSGDTSLHDGDTSKATLSFVMHLIFCDLSAQEADLVVRASGLYRDKWDSKRGDGTWGDNEISTAISLVEKTKAQVQELHPIFESQSILPASETGIKQALSESDSVIETYNSEYFTAPEGTNVFVFRESYDFELEHSKLVKQTFDGFRKLHPEKVMNSGKLKQAAAIWLDSPQRRNYKDGLVFSPNGNTPTGCYNLWKGFSIEPTQEYPTLLLDYLKEVICDGNQQNYHYLINWLAYCVQYPGRQGGVAVVCRGEKGTGKGTLGRMMKEIFGCHGIQISNPRHLTGNFNAHLRGTAFLFADEAFFAGDKAGEGVLKSIITEKTIAIEQKGIDVVEVRNRLKIMMASNNDWVVPTSADERRYFCLDVSPKYMGIHAYWNQLNSYIATGGKEAFLGHLLSIDLKDFDVHRMPNTKGLDKQKIQGLGVIESLVNDWLTEGGITSEHGGYTELKEQENWVYTHVVQEGILKHCKNNHSFRTPSIVEIGKKLKKLVNVDRKQKREDKSKRYFYVFPPLTEARAAFMASQNLSESQWKDITEQGEK